MDSEVEQLHSCADSLFVEFEQGGGTGCIGEAIVLDRQALERCPPGHPRRWATLIRLQSHLFHRHNELGTVLDIEEAIILAREALDLCPRGHPDRPWSLNSLAADLYALHQQLGETANLDEAIVLDRECLDLCPRGDPDRPMSVNNLAIYLSARYRLLGLMTDLNEAIALGREAMHFFPLGHPDHSTSLTNLALYLSYRYNQLGAMADLDKAIVLTRKALDLHPQGHLLRSSSLNNLAHFLFTRYHQIWAMIDLEEAITLIREAVDLRPQGHPYRPVSLNNLACYLSARYKQYGIMMDLDDAIALTKEVLDLYPQGHPDRSTSLKDLAAHLFIRYNQLGARSDLDEAIILGREGLRLCPLGRPNRSRTLGNLACYLKSRFTELNQLQDKEELFSLYTELGCMSHISSSSDLSAAKDWVKVAEDFRHPTTLHAYETSLQLLIQHLAILPSLPQHLPVFKSLTSSVAVNAFSACLRNQNPVKAVELLEQGRGVFWNQIIRLHSPVDDVITSGPAGKILADEFTRLTSLIHRAIDSPGADQHDRLCRLYLDLDKVVTNIRKLPGLTRFLLPSLFSELQYAASDGPVIIVNASQYTCDALVVFMNRDPVHIPLHITKTRVQELASELQSLTLRAKKMNVTRNLAIILRNLWDEVVSPIVSLLRTTLPAQSRVWWCATAEFSYLPLHAAGPYRRGQENLSDLYVSSYTPTLAALIRAKLQASSSSGTNRKHFLAVGQRGATGESELISVGTELDIIGHRIEGLAAYRRIEGQEARVSRVSEELCKNDWVHFACHGVPNRKQPLQSAFALHDGHFTIERIMRCELRNPQFAYLSACHTTVGDEESPDEVIHLASAMHFAGFSSVIGTMWGVDDGQTNKITSIFYVHMINESGHLDYTRAAFALNETMRKVDIPFDQRILYIHIGA